MFSLLSVIVEHGVLSLDHPFSYAYTGSERIRAGMRVQVSFGRREIMGFIVSEPKTVNQALEEYNAAAEVKLKPISRIIDSEPIIGNELLTLARQAADYYLCPLIELLKAMLPPSLRPDTQSLSKPKRAFKEVYVISGDNTGSAGLSRTEAGLAAKLRAHPEGLTRSEIGAKAALGSLVAKGIVRLEKKEKLRLPFVEADESEEHTLDSEQEKAYEEIKGSDDSVFLLQGVTGSGKTEIYIKLAEDYLARGLSSIILVPEISLTDRLITRFKGLFGSEAALLHSGLTDSQKYDEYVRIARGDAHIVIGARSAVFAPVMNLGLIVVDEEHVLSYKQDTMPFYDARQIAKMRIAAAGGKLVFGSATPSLECRARADKGVYHLVRLLSRFNSLPLPKTQIVDLSDYGNIDYESTLLSLPLRAKLAEVLRRGRQAILLLNRRGYAPVYICRKCQRVLKCPECNVPLTWHKSDSEVICHHCGYELKSDDLVCPHCGGRDFGYLGFGTERVVEELTKFFPSARIMRFDADAVRGKGRYHQLISAFQDGRYDFMVGTQMVAKGHDFPLVSLAAALLADQSLEFPSYKANEDTFDLLTQLSGRAGRQDETGEALIQTYSKDNDIIRLSCLQDYEAFYKYEMANRRARQYPPYAYLIIITISGKDRARTEEASYRIKNYLIGEIAKPAKRALIFGPSVPYVERVANRYNRKIMIKYKNRGLIQDALKGLSVLQLGSSDIRLSVDVDPSSDI